MKRAIKTTICSAVSLSMILALTPGLASGQSQTQVQESDLAQKQLGVLDETLAQDDYQQGEVLAVWQDSALTTGTASELLENAQVLTTTDAQTYQQTTGDNSAIASEEIKIGLVSSTAMSTHDMLETLLNSPAVLSAEPNGVSQVTEEETTAASTTTASQATIKTSSSLKTKATASKIESIPASSFAKSKDITSSVCDLSGYQWAYNNSNVNMKLPDNVTGFQTSSPNWNTEGATNTNEDTVVAVFDSGIDYTHPDLKDVMFDVQAAGYDPQNRGGRYGINTISSGNSSSSDIMDDNMHGTHVAGIIAGKWDGKGVSGISSGVKLIAVKALNAKGNVAESDSIAGFSYLSYLVDNGLNLASVNCSWGGSDSSIAYALGLRELTERGVVVCFASGNDGEDNDTGLFTSTSLRDIPGVVVVGNANKQGYASHTSNYGQNTVDIFAPGDNILSSVPAKAANYIAAADPDPAYFESFSDTSTTAEFYKVPGSDTPYAAKKQIGALSSEASFDNDGKCWRIDWNGESSMDIEVRIPVTMAQIKKMSAVGIAVSAPGNTTTSLTIADAQVGEAQYQNTLDIVSTDSSDSWCYLSISMEKILNYLGTKDAGIAYKDGMLSLKLSIDNDGETVKGAPVYIDAIGAGSNVVDYEICTGTSMATPVATGAAAVLSSQIPSSVTGSARSATLAAMLRSSVKQCSSLSKKCTSGGLLDLSQPAGSVPAAVKITQDENNAVTLEGMGFGSTPGSIAIGKKTATIANWSDTKVVFTLPTSIKSGLKDIVITSGSGKKSCARRALTASTGSLKLFDQTIPVPASKSGDPGAYQYGLMASTRNNLYTLVMDTNQHYQILWRYNTITKKWKRCANMPAACSDTGTQLNAVRNKLVVYGSIAEGKAKLFVYTPSTDTWKTVAARNVPEASATAAFHGQLIAIGGMSKNGTELKAIRAINLKTGNAHAIGTLKHAISSVFCATYGDHIWLFENNLDDSGKTIGDFTRVDWNAKSGKFISSKLSKVKLKGYTDINSGISLTGTARGLLVTGAYQKKTNGMALAKIYRITGTGNKAKYTVLKKVPTYSPPLAIAGCMVGGTYYVRTSIYYDNTCVSLRATTLRAKTLSFMTSSKTRYHRNGSAYRTGIKVYNANGKVLKRGVNYTVSYRSNKHKGTAYVVVRGKGSYKGTIISPFRVR